MRTLVLLAFFLMLTTYSNASYSRYVPNDTIPDTSQSQFLEDALPSDVSAVAGIGTFFFGMITSGLFLNDKIDQNIGIIFSIGWIIGLVAIISGIAGLSASHKMRKTNLTKEGFKKAKRIKRRSIAGIIFGIIGIGITLFLFLLSFAFV